MCYNDNTMGYPQLITDLLPPVGAFRIFVAGEPEPSGSPKIIRMGGKPAIRWQKGPKWTNAIRRALLDAIPAKQRPRIEGPVRGWLDFIMPRPAKPKFMMPATPPDLDKLARAVFDGMVYRDVEKKQQPLLIEDDARFVSCILTERYVTSTLDPDGAGVEIWVWPA